MNLSKLVLKNWKCFPHKEVIFDDTHVLITGDNGAGKTSILHALYFAHHLKLPNGLHWKDAIGPEENHAHIELHFADTGHGRVYLDKTKGTIRLFVGDKSVTRKAWHEHINSHAIMVDSMSLNILYLSPSLRREFLDDVLSMSSLGYHKTLAEYRQLQTQRNKLLHAIREGTSSRNELGYWDNQLIQRAITIYDARKDFFDWVSDRSMDLVSILDDHYDLRFEPISKLDLGGDIEAQMREYFEKNHQKEVILARTLRGPHLDEWKISINKDEGSICSTEYLSRGENKMLFVKLSQIIGDYLVTHNSKPVTYLLDDVFAELDEHHIKMISQLGLKKVITTSQRKQIGWNSHILEIESETKLT